MVRVSGGPFQWGNAAAVDLPPYLLGKYEVTNREFKKFVYGGGYKKSQYWKEPFVKDGHTLTWEQAVQLTIKLYLDFANFFIFLLRYLLASRRR